MVSLKLPCIARGARVSREHSTTPAFARRVQTKCVRKVSASETRSFVNEYQPPKTNYSFWTCLHFCSKSFKLATGVSLVLLRLVLRTFFLTLQIHWLVRGFSVKGSHVYFVGLSVSKFNVWLCWISVWFPVAWSVFYATRMKGFKLMSLSLMIGTFTLRRVQFVICLCLIDLNLSFLRCACM